MTVFTNKSNVNFENVFKKFYVPLCRYAYTLVPDQSICEDLVQDVFLKIWNKTPQINTSLSSYLYRAVKNSCIDHMRKSVQQSIIPIEEIEELIESPIDINMEENLEKMKNKVESAIQNLPPRCREVFIMRKNLEMSYDEISNTLNISKKTIENHINLAIKKLRSELQKSELLIYFFFSRRK